MAKSASTPNRSPAPSGAVPVQNVTHQSFEGPIPPPALLKGYEDIVSGAAARILALSEQESVHRRNLEIAVTQANIDAQKRQMEMAEYQARAIFKSDAIGQVLGAVISILSIVAAVYLAVQGQALVAAGLIGLPLAGVVRALRNHPKTQEKS